MFTGIVEEIGFIKSFDGKNLMVECKKVLENTKIGDALQSTAAARQSFL